MQIPKGHEIYKRDTKYIRERLKIRERHERYQKGTRKIPKRNERLQKGTRTIQKRDMKKKSKGQERSQRETKVTRGTRTGDTKKWTRKIPKRENKDTNRDIQTHKSSIFELKDA